MRWLASLIASLLLTSTAWAGSIGVFTAADGEVRVLRGENYLAAVPGVEVTLEDIVETDKNASAQIDMDDGSVLRLGPETRMVLSDYRLDSNKSVASATVEVLSGWLRFAVAKLKPQGSYDIHTPVLTIGVRGTEGTIEAQNDRGGLFLHEGLVDVKSVGTDLKSSQAARVAGGEYIERTHGQAFTRLSQPPPAFRKRLPPIMEQRLARRAHLLKQRGVPPKMIRRVTRADARRLMELHPHMRERLHRRFRPLGVGGPFAPERRTEIQPGTKDLSSEEQKEESYIGAGKFNLGSRDESLRPQMAKQIIDSSMQKSSSNDRRQDDFARTT